MKRIHRVLAVAGLALALAAPAFAENRSTARGLKLNLSADGVAVALK